MRQRDGSRWGARGPSTAQAGESPDRLPPAGPGGFWSPARKGPAPSRAVRAWRGRPSADPALRGRPGGVRRYLIPGTGRARSVFNSTSDDWCLYQTENFGGEWRLVEPGAPVTSPASPTAVSSLRRSLKAAADRPAALGVRCPASVPGDDVRPVVSFASSGGGPGVCDAARPLLTPSRAVRVRAADVPGPASPLHLCGDYPGHRSAAMGGRAGKGFTGCRAGGGGRSCRCRVPAGRTAGRRAVRPG